MDTSHKTHLFSSLATSTFSSQHAYRKEAIIRWKKKKKTGLVGLHLTNAVEPQPIVTLPPQNSSPPQLTPRQQLLARWHAKRARRHQAKTTPPASVRLCSNEKGMALLDIIPTQSSVLHKAPDCNHCHAKRFPHETDAFCCSGGDVVLATCRLPSILMDLLDNQTDEAKKFRTSIRSYNNHLAFTSLEATYDKELAKRNQGVYTCLVQGQLYHFLDDLTATHGNPRNLQLYFHDTEYEMTNRLQHCPRLFQMTLAQILTVLETNPYANFFRDLTSTPNLDEHEIVLYCNPQVDQKIYNKPTVPQVAAILVDGQENEQRSIRVYAHGGQTHTIKYYFGCYDPLQYPLMFPYGQLGWHQGIGKKGLRLNTRKRKRLAEYASSINPHHNQSVQELLHQEIETLNTEIDDPNYVSVREYYCYKFQMREDDDSYLLRFGRLFQQYAVDMFVKLETQRLDYYRLQQKNIRQEFRQGIADAVASGETDCGKVGQRTVLPASFTGGPRNMRKKYMNAMTLVQKFGKPDIFLTMTCNPDWPEIREMLRSGELSQDRPDLIARVFRSKLEELKTELFKKQIFGKVAAYTYVIEFQKRGLPHAHFLLILKPQSKLFRPEEFDKIVSSELPDKELYPHLYKLVVKHMLHGPCGTDNPKNVCMKSNGYCRNAYPKEFSEETVVTTDVYPKYKRRDNGVKVKVRNVWLDNRWVIPHNPYLLARFDCHINVEICSTIKAVKYVHKCICKGNDRILFNVTNKDSPEEIDEIDQYQSARWVSPPEALWRIYKFSLGEMKPPVIQLPLHLENYQPVNYNHKLRLANVLNNPYHQKTMLTEYFTMNRTNLDAQRINCTYAEFPDYFVWLADQKRWKLRSKGDSIGRIVTVQPIEGERFYLRLLLTKVRCPKSYMDLKTYNGQIFNTYQETALARGLLKENNSQELCLTEASSYHMPYELRRLFATLLVYCCPNEPKKLWLKFETCMSEDFARQPQLTKLDVQNKVLEQINTFLQAMGKDISAFGLMTDSYRQNIREDLTKETRAEQNIIVSTLDMEAKTLLNEEQKHAFESITTAVYQGQSKAFFIDGSGGTGKTFLYRALLADVRSRGFIALATATSGIAASLLPGGRTAHSRFRIPIDLVEGSTCRISKQTSLAHMIREAGLIIWDEAPMCKKTAVEALDDLLKDLMENPSVFGGKVVVLGGDFRQILPVVRNGTKKETINACLIKSRLWSQLQKITLVTNMRARLDPQFTEFVLNIGNGLGQTHDIEYIALPHNILIPTEKKVDSLDSLITNVFADFTSTLATTSLPINRAILTTKNEFVDEINDLIISRFPGDETVYNSFDETHNPDDHGQFQDMLNSLSSNGLPPNRLILKKNAPIILLRNIDPTEGLCNGTRLICKHLDKHIIHAEIAIGEFAGRTVFIHRIPFQPPTDEFYPVPFKRIQFPVRLCFAMTINKAQGQTLDSVGIYLKEPVFSHGQLYVALSRAKTSTAVSLVITPTFFASEKTNLTKNIVYKEILQAPTMNALTTNVANITGQQIIHLDYHGS